MPYVKQTWVDDVTVIDKAHMDHIEDGLVALDAASGGGGAVAALFPPVVLSSPGSFDFTSIPQTYNDLIAVIVARGTNAGSSDYVALTFNGDAAGHYNWQRSFANNTTVNGLGVLNDTCITVGQVPQQGAFGGAASGVFVIEVINYKSTTLNKPVITRGSTWLSDAAADFYSTANSGLWKQTAAITRLTLKALFGASGNFDTGSSARLYGRQ